MAEQQTTSTNGEFGNSEFGGRLVYEEKGLCADWRDRFWAIFYYVHIVLIIAFAIAFNALGAGIVTDEICCDTCVNRNNFPYNSRCPQTPSPTISGTIVVASSDINDALTAIFVTLLCQCVAGACFGLIWLKVMQKFAESIIKGMLFLMLFLWVVVIIMGIALDAIYLTILGAVFLLIAGLYTYCVWKLIPFSSALLSIASSITQTFEGTICISLCVIPFSICWYFLWATAVIGAYDYYYLDTTDWSKDCYNSLDPCESTESMSGFVWFLFLISLYWGLQVHKNVSHTTTCGVTATWFFSPKGTVRKPTMPALKRTLTTSFGSVALGSFIVAILKATRTMLRGMRRGPLGCIVYCILACIENLMRFFNMFAFAQCAIYGSSFIEAAKATWGLFLSKGFHAIINDDLIGLALFAGSFLSLVVSAVLGYFIFRAFYPGDDSFAIAIAILIAVYGGLLGYYLCITILFVVRSSVVCLFVCFAEDPNAMKQNRQEEYDRLCNSRAEIQTFASTGHTGVGQENNAEQNT